MDWSADARQCAHRSLRRHGLCLVGEVHGVAENPLVIERLVEELGVEIVALEWPRRLERAIAELLGPATPDERDAAMARNVERLLGSGSHGVLSVAGNLHTRLCEHAFYRPAGMHLARERSELCALDIHYARGGCWNDGPRMLNPTVPPAGPYLLVPEATEAVVLSAPSPGD